MSVVIRFTADEEVKALPVLLRHSPGTVLVDRTYIVEKSVVQSLRDAGINFRELTPPITMPFVEDVSIGERI